MFGFHNFIKRTVLIILMTWNEVLKFIYTDMEADDGISIEPQFCFLVIFYSYC